jgi:hypothetical protein
MPSSLGSAEVQQPGSLPAPDHAIRVALVPTLLVLVGTMIYQLFKRKS